MKAYFPLFAMTVLLGACSVPVTPSQIGGRASADPTARAATAPVVPQYVASPADWSLFFQDEFDGPTLNPAWNPFYFGYYTDLARAKTTYELDGDHFVGEIFNTTAYWDPVSSPGYKCTGMTLGNRDYVHPFNLSEVVQNHTPTMDQFVTRYGYFEMRAKLPSGSGLCPAWWMVGFQDTVAQDCEIDILEYRGMNPTRITSTLHPIDDKSITKTTVDLDLKVDLSKDFHTYTLEWDPTFLKATVDGVQTLYTNQSPSYRMLMFLSFNQHDNNPWLGPLDPNLPNPKKMVVDYLRIYKKNSWPTPPTPTPVPVGGNLARRAYASSLGSSVAYYQTNPMYNFTDGNLNTSFWGVDGQKTPTFLYLDWTGGPQTFDTVAFKGNFCLDQGISLFDVEVADDVSGPWTTVATDVRPAWKFHDATIETWAASFSPVTTQHLRIAVKDYHKKWGKYAFSELEVRRLSSGASVNVAPLGTVTSSFANGQGSRTGQVNDEVLETGWASGSPVKFPGYITLDFGALAPTVDRLSLVTHFGVGQGITNLDVEAFNGTAWVPVATNAALVWKLNTAAEETCDIRFPAVKTSQWRMKVTGAHTQWGNIALNELQAWTAP